MIVPAYVRLLLFMLAASLPIWTDWVATSQDWSLRGLLKPALGSIYAGIVVMLARTRNPEVDGQQTP